MDSQIHNTNIASEAVITSPNDLSKKLPITQKGKRNIMAGREVVNDILSRKDSRLMVIVGPCSIHNLEAAKEYAHNLDVIYHLLAEVFNTRNEKQDQHLRRQLSKYRTDIETLINNE